MRRALVNAAGYSAAGRRVKSGARCSARAAKRFAGFRAVQQAGELGAFLPHGGGDVGRSGAEQGAGGAQRLGRLGGQRCGAA